MPMAQYLNNPSMSELRYKHLRFLITDSPADESLQSFIEVYIKRIQRFHCCCFFLHRLV